MSSTTRRQILMTATSLGTTMLGACGGGDDAESPVSAHDAKASSLRSGSRLAPPAGPAPTPVPTAGPKGKYRTSQKHLFQTVPAKNLPKRLADGRDFLFDIFGPTYAYVDFHCGWLWTRGGGDWLDKNLVRHGPTPWFSIPVNQVSGNAAVASYSGDVTAVLQHVQAKGRWCAFLLQSTNAYRVMAGMFNRAHAAPSIDVTYTSGQKARLACRLVGVNSTSSKAPGTVEAEYTLPAFIEFQQPTSAVAQATFNFVITQHWGGANAVLTGFLLDPPVLPETAVPGLAASAGLHDSGIDANPMVIGSHNYADGKQLSDFVYDGNGNYLAEKNYDPAIYGTGATDTTKFPHAGLGKWVNPDPSWKLVNSGYSGDGFKPLVPGMGALKLAMPATPGVVDGSLVGYGGTLAGNSMIFLPEPLFGTLGRIFVRYYFRLGTPTAPLPADRKQVYNSPGSAEWTTQAGKFGIGPDHTTSYGGVSGSSGGGFGWQMRLLWADCDAGTAGPDEGGWAAGYHLYDFGTNNPPGYRYGVTQLSAEERWGQRGGSGGVLYAGQWYCIETELKLNTATGSGFTPDGELRAWVDGRLVYERSGMVFRTAPILAAPYNPDKLRPCRQLGVRGLWLNWFHGGKTVSTIDRTSFYTGLVWAKDYIGPMKM